VARCPTFTDAAPKKWEREEELGNRARPTWRAGSDRMDGSLVSRLGGERVRAADSGLRAHGELAEQRGGQRVVVGAAKPPVLAAAPTFGVGIFA